MSTGIRSSAQTFEATARREIRVFISSTFRDMQKERELLVKTVFPDLRRLCDERFVSFTEVDLRWGITEEQAAEGRVLPICLEEIERSRPYFIGLLGERYGWIPTTVPPEVLARETWIQEHVVNGTSVTELEILHGVLRNPAMAGHAFFYFRDPAYIATLSADEQREMVERDVPEDIREFGPEETARRTQQRKDRLAALKDTIRQSGLPLVEPYANPEALAATVHRQFIALIDQLYPKEQVPDPLDQEAIGHHTYARRKLVAYVDRPARSRAIKAFVEAPSTGQGLVVTGDSGGGKTALLAASASSFLNHPSSFLFEHYFGATPGSTSVDGFLRRLLGELKRLAGIQDEIPASPEKMREILPQWLAQTSGGKPIVLVLDALNQIQGDEADRRLGWLPRPFPPHVRVVASCLPGPALETLRQRGWAEHELPLADAAERGQMIDAFLKGLYNKTLSPPLRHRIVNAPGSANPLFLRTVLEELRQFGNFEKLPEQVGEYLEAETPQELFRRVIRRWQGDFHAGRDVVSRSLRHLWTARHGLGDAEWLDLLADAQGPMDRQTWRPLLLAMEPHLVQRGSLWAFGHDFLRQAVAPELVPTEEQRRQAHRVLADYFEQQLTGPRKAEELPWQLREAGERERLPGHLLDIPLFLLMRKRDQNELMGYWVWLNQERTMGQPYVQALDLWAADKGEDPEVAYAANELGFFLNHAALYIAAEPLYRRALAIDEASFGAEHPKEAIHLNNLAQLLQATNRLGEAEPLMRRALAIAEASFGSEHPKVATGLNNLAQLLQDTNRLGEAEPLMRRALAIAEASFGAEHPNVAIRLNNLAQLLKATNRLGQAEPLMRRALAIDEASFGAEHPDVALKLNNLAALLQATNRLGEAEPLMRRALAIDEASFGAEHPDVARDLNNLAGLLQATNRLGEAEPLMRRAVEILLRFTRGTGHPHPRLQTSVGNYTGLLEAMGKSGEEIGRTMSDLGGRYGVILGEPTPEQRMTALRGTALLHVRNGQYAEATEILNQLLEAGFEIPGTHCHLARICLLTDRFDDAREHARQAWEHRAEAPPYVIPRIFWLQLACYILNNPQSAFPNPNSATLLGRLKTALEIDGAHMEWTMDPVLEHLRPRLASDTHALLTALVAALSNAANLSALDAFPAWREATPKPLE